MSSETRTEWGDQDDMSGQHGTNGDRKLTMLKVSEIIAFEDDPANVLLSNGYIEKGSPCVLCGPPGIGKSRLALQLAIKSVLGEGFLGWDTTNAAGLKWGFLQSENGMRRLKADLSIMTKDLAKPQMELLDQHMLIHGLVQDTDGHLDLADPLARKRIAEFIQDWKPNIVVGDPLTAFGIGDLNSDKDMLVTARDYGRIVRANDPSRTPFMLHHARTGKDAAAGVSGMDRASYARNSKALYGWTRSQFNVAPVNADNNDKLFFASGKCNNAREFEEFIIELDLETMFYSKTGEDVAGAKEQAKQGSDGKFQKKIDRKDLAKLMSVTVPRPRIDILRECLDRKLMSERSFDTYWSQLKKFDEIRETPDHKWHLR